MRSNHTTVEISKEAVSLLDYVSESMRSNGSESEDVDAYVSGATRLDYDNLVDRSVDKLHEINYNRRMG